MGSADMEECGEIEGGDVESQGRGSWMFSVAKQDYVQDLHCIISGKNPLW